MTATTTATATTVTTSRCLLGIYHILTLLNSFPYINLVNSQTGIYYSHHFQMSKWKHSDAKKVNKDYFKELFIQHILVIFAKYCTDKCHLLPRTA